LPLADPLDAARDTLIATVEGLRATPVTDAEVERVRSKALRRFDDTFNDPQRLGVAISESIALGDWRLFFLQRDHWRKVSAADVQRVALAYLKSSNRTVGLFVPDAKPDRAPAPEIVDIAAMVKDYKGDPGVSAGEAFDPTPANLEARTQRFVLPNGMKVALLPKKTTRRNGALRPSRPLRRRDFAQGNVAARRAHRVDALCRHAQARSAGIRGPARPASRQARHQRWRHRDDRARGDAANASARPDAPRRPKRSPSLRSRRRNSKSRGGSASLRSTSSAPIRKTSRSVRSSAGTIRTRRTTSATSRRSTRRWRRSPRRSSTT
jgi:hypothetical protein